MDPKSLIRQKYLALRDNFNYDAVSEEIFIKAFELIKTLKFRSFLAGYYSTGSELNILPLLTKLKAGHIILLPRVTSSDKMNFCIWDKELEKNSKHNFQQPKFPNIIIPEIIITPLITCDKLGNRIGYGKGFYDKYFNYRPKIIKIGLIAKDLIYPEIIPSEKHDVKLDYLVTEEKVISTS